MGSFPVGRNETALSAAITPPQPDRMTSGSGHEAMILAEKYLRNDLSFVLPVALATITGILMVEMSQGHE